MSEVTAKDEDFRREMRAAADTSQREVVRANKRVDALEEMVAGLKRRVETLEYRERRLRRAVADE